MIRQKPISAKIYEDLLQELDKEAEVSLRKRNAIINAAVRTYILLQDTRRLYRCASPTEKARIYLKLMEEIFPETYYQGK